MGALRGATRYPLPVTLPDHVGRRVKVLARGWLHGNVVALPGADPVVIDTGYHRGAAAVEAFAVEALGTLQVPIWLTHVHADHAGGVAALRAVGAGPVLAHDDARAIVDRWDERALWLGATGQELPRFGCDGSLVPGHVLSGGDRAWQVVDAPGHATGGVMFFEPHDGVLISGDALWEDGLGAVDPWIDGPERWELALHTLDRIEALAPRWVVPGHGEPFADVAGALQRARSRLGYLRSRPDRLQALMVRGLLGFLHMARPELSAEALRAHGLAIARERQVPVATREEVVEGAVIGLLRSTP